MPRPLEVPNADDLIARYVSGASELQLARELGRSRCVVRRLLVSRGIQPRGLAEAQATSWRVAKQLPNYREKVVSTCSRAWSAARRRVHTVGEREARALTMAGRARRLGKYEREVFDAIALLGGRISWQTPIGPYNVDLAFREDRVAVEIQRQAVRTDRVGACSLRRERIEHILNSGWHVVVVFCPDRFTWSDRRTKSGRAQSIDVAAVAEYLVSFANETRRNPSSPREYRVISGNAKPAAAASVQFDNLA